MIMTLCKNGCVVVTFDSRRSSSMCVQVGMCEEVATLITRRHNKGVPSMKMDQLGLPHTLSQEFSFLLTTHLPVVEAGVSLA